ncbi:Coiled-coil domain-containing protein 77 [Blyttiomyces sp. JEL0837]|nr:Coiled-coil domain-containing protein 77 [Blyttiomyces sp. JEL0837]
MATSAPAQGTGLWTSHSTSFATTPWQTSAISTSTQRQNIRLTTLLALLNRTSGGDGLNAFNRRSSGRSDDDGEDLSYDNLHPGAGFEKNFSEIQKLLDRAKNMDDPEQNVSLMNSDQDKELSASSPSQRAPAHPIFEMGNLVDGSKVVQVGRKPLRVIAAELSKRIDMLKTNQAEWEIFQARIHDYQKNTTTQTDIIRHNKEVLASFFPDLRQKTLADQHSNFENHRAMVLEKKKEIDEQRLRRKLEVVQKKDSAMDSHIKRWKYIRYNQAAVLIQRGWKAYSSRLLEEKKRNAMIVIGSAFRVYVHRRREKLKHKSADIVRQFFKEVHDCSKLMKVVKKYRFSVIKAQGMCRAYLNIRNSQVTLICKYWDKLESGWWAQRKLHGGGDKNGSNVSLDEKVKSAKKKKVKKAKEEDKEKAAEKIPPIRVSDATKIAIVLEDLLARKQAYRKLLVEYRDQLARWNLDQKQKFQPKRVLLSGLKKSDKGEDDKGAPKKPHFKVLPSVAEMNALIEKGFFVSAKSPLHVTSNFSVKRMADSSDLLSYYRQRLGGFVDTNLTLQLTAYDAAELEYQDALNSIDSLKISHEDHHKLSWQLHRREVEIADLQRALSDAQTQLFDERKQLLRLIAENDELKIQELKDRKKLNYLLSFGISPESEVTYFRTNLDKRHVKGRAPLKESAPQANNADSGAAKRPTPGGEEVEYLNLTISSLRSQLDEQRRTYEEIIAGFERDRKTLFEEDKIRQEHETAKIGELMDKLNSLRALNRENIREMLHLKKTYHSNERRLIDDKAKLTQEILDLKNKLSAEKTRQDSAEKMIEVAVSKKHEDTISDLKTQLLQTQDDFRECNQKLLEMEKSTKKRANQLTERLHLLTTSYNNLKRRRDYEIEGFTNDILLLRKQLKVLEKSILKYGPLEDRELVLLNLARETGQRAARISSDLQDLKVTSILVRAATETSYHVFSESSALIEVVERPAADMLDFRKENTCLSDLHIIDTELIN